MASKKIGTLIKIGMMAAGIIPTVWVIAQNVLSPDSGEEETAETEEVAETPETEEAEPSLPPSEPRLTAVEVPPPQSNSPRAVLPPSQTQLSESDSIRRSLRQGVNPTTALPLTEAIPTPAVPVDPLPPPYLGNPSIVSQGATTLDVVQWNPELVAQAFLAPAPQAPIAAQQTNPPALPVPPVNQLQSFSPPLPAPSSAQGEPIDSILELQGGDFRPPNRPPEQLTLTPLPLEPEDIQGSDNPFLSQNSPTVLDPQPLDPCDLNNPERSPNCPPVSVPPRPTSRLIPLTPPEVDLGTEAPAVSAGGTTIGTPSASGAYWGTAGIGVGYQERARFTDKEDASVGIGIGFGNPQRNVGIQLGVGLVDLSDILADGSVSIKFHRQIRPDLNIAVGANGFETWGGPDGGSSLYGVATKRWQIYQNPRRPFSQVTVSAGLGGGQFRSEADINKGNNSVNGFGSVAVRLSEPLTGIVEWTGQDLNLGISFSPFREWPIVTSLAVNDVTGKAGDGPRFTAGIGMGFSFLEWFR